MAEPESILIAHYQAVREEEMERIRHRDRYVVWYATLSTAAAGVFIKDSEWWGLMAAIPLLSAIIGMLYAHTDVTLGSLSHWLRYRYTEVLKTYQEANNIAFELPHWDGSTVHKEYVRDVAFGLRYMVVSVLVSGIGTGALVLAWEPIEAKVPNCYWVVLGVELIIFLAIAFISPLWAWHKRIQQA